MFKSLILASASLALMDTASIPPGAKTGKSRRWFEMKKTADDTGEILIYDEIGPSFWNDNAMSAKDFDDELKALGDVKFINLRINSPGGNVFDGIAIMNAVRNHPAEVTASIDGIAASIASVVAMGADKIVMPENAFMLIHEAGGMVFGNGDDMTAMAADLKRIDQSVIATYAARSAQKPDKIRAIMKEDRLMDATEALALGLVDEVKPAVKIAAKFQMRLLPKAAAERFQTVMTEETSPEPAPPLAQEGGEPGASSSEDPAPSNVIKLQTDAKAAGRSEYRAYVTEVHSLCNLAGLPAMAQQLIATDKSVEDVKAALVKAKADADNLTINPHHSAAPPAASSMWKKATDKINARIKQVAAK